MEDKKIFNSKLYDRGFFLTAGFFGLTWIIYIFSFFINDKLDWEILLLLNPDSYIPLIEEFMVLVSDYSMFHFGLVFVAWEIAYQLSKKGDRARLKAKNALMIIGAILSLIFVFGYFLKLYEHSIIFLPLSVINLAGFWFIARILVSYKEENLKKINYIFWLTILSALLAELSAEWIIKDVVGRPRPLSDTYSAYNWGIRCVTDEVVIRGKSYVAGHSTVFFAIVTPMIYLTENRGVKTGLILWAMVHSFSRVYLAAHFPYCSLMGSILGFLMGTLVVIIFRGTTRQQTHGF